MIFGDPDINEEKTINLNREFETANRINPDKSVYSNLSLADQVLMIFTSGTTGLPKGNMTHDNFFYSYKLYGIIINLTRLFRIFQCL